MTRLSISMNPEPPLSADQPVPTQNPTSTGRLLPHRLPIHHDSATPKTSLANREVSELPSNDNSLIARIAEALKPSVSEDDFNNIILTALNTKEPSNFEVLQLKGTSSSSPTKNDIENKMTSTKTPLVIKPERPNNSLQSSSSSAAPNDTFPTYQPLPPSTKNLPSENTSSFHLKEKISHEKKTTPSYKLKPSDIAFIKLLIKNPTRKGLQVALINTNYKGSTSTGNLCVKKCRILRSLKNLSDSDRATLLNEGITQIQIDQLFAPTYNFTDSQIIFIKALIANPRIREIQKTLKKTGYKEATTPNGISTKKHRILKLLKTLNNNDIAKLLDHGITQDQINQLTGKK